MSFLTPLYLLGALAIALPVLAHLIRRTPPRRREFSSVMFLTPAPPKVTRRSRIEHWPLLCLRALIIGLLALAFARPLWRTPVVAEELPDARWAAVLVDTSASLRRDGLWDEARRRLETVLNQYAPADRVGVFTFDGAPRLAWSWDAWAEQDPARRPEAVAAALADLSPGWRETNLAEALITAVESLENEAARPSGSSLREIVLISDLQSGSRLDALQGYAWPENVRLRIERVGADASPNNAGMHLATAAAGAVRVRIDNAEGATTETFQLRWRTVDSAASPPADRHDADVQSTVDVVVPAGQSRIVRVPPPPDNATVATLLLAGDDHPFDNACYISVPQPHQVAIAWIGSDDPSDPAAQRFYLAPLFSSTSERQVEIVDWDRGAPHPRLTTAPLRLVLLADRPTPDELSALQDFVRRGGLVVHVLQTPEAAADLAALAGAGPIDAAEADVQGYSLLTDVDFEHPALEAFAAPQYSDFTALRFWKHRRVDVSGLPHVRILAKFDDGDVAIAEVPVGAGRIVFFTSGWSRADSQLAIWSKFVPLMNALLNSALPHVAGDRPLIVGAELPLPAPQSVRAPAAPLMLTRPDGSTQPVAPEAPAPFADQPGIYRLHSGDGLPPLVAWGVNLAPSESDTTPLAPEQLEALGVPLAAAIGDGVLAAAAPMTQADLSNAEHEQRQRLWRWVLLAVLGLLVLETAWARRLAPRP